MSTESDETTVAIDVAEAGGSSGMSRLESLMSQMQTCQLCFDNLLELGHDFAREWASLGL